MFPYRAPLPKSVYAARGCLECRMTGYAGRIGIYEMMAMTPGSAQAGARGDDLGALREQALRDGMKPLRASGALKAATGITSVEEVLKVAPPVGAEPRSG